MATPVEVEAHLRSHGILMDAGPNANVRPGIPRIQWQTAVRNQLKNLWEEMPCDSSRAVLNSIAQTGRSVTIRPGANKSQTDQDPTNWANATPQGAGILSCANTAPLPGMTAGTGTGSSTIVHYVPQDWPMYNSIKPGEDRDEVLLHELVHALRSMRGQLLCAATPQPQISASKGTTVQYDTFEEFVAILVTNIYRSENKRPNLRLDHQGFRPLPTELTTSNGFRGMFAKQISKMVNEMGLLCFDLAQVNCQFNPLREEMRARRIIT